jgi:hypothetical protein
MIINKVLAVMPPHPKSNDVIDARRFVNPTLGPKVIKRFTDVICDISQ